MCLGASHTQRVKLSSGHAWWFQTNVAMSYFNMDTITFDDNAHDNMFVLEIGKEVTIWRAFAQ